MRLKKIIKLFDYVSIRNYRNIKINDFKNNSKDVLEKDIFFSIKGLHSNEIDNINEAINNGALVIIYEDELNDYNHNIIYIKVLNSKKALASVITKVNKPLLKKTKIIGVTGTNGKTTITSILHKFFELKKTKSMLIGTNGVYYLDKHIETINTTPDIISLINYFKEAEKNKIQYVIMEVSSIASSEYRVFNIPFYYLIMTNLSLDHLDYHHDFKSYLYSKAILFNNVKKACYLNLDDDSLETINNITKCRTYTYSIKEISHLDFNLNKMTFMFDNYIYYSNLIGKHNAYNLLVVIKLLHEMKYSYYDISNTLSQINKVDGRMERIVNKDTAIIVDYAHTPDALLNILDTSKKLSNELCVVMGCGGNRDKTKRSIIGNILDKYASTIILTNDNPRDENPEDIINDILLGIKNKNKVITIQDRFLAIEKGISIKPKLLLVLGRGNEEFQKIKNELISFNDIKIINSILGI